MSVSPKVSAPVAARRRRSDATQNRSRILEAARAALADSPDPTMQSIAKVAGIGQGTMYRHFPHREALLAEVYRDEFEGLITAAHTLRRDLAPLLAVRRWFDELAVFGRQKHALADVLDAATRAELHSEQYDRILDAVDELLAAGKQAGEIRPDVVADEIFALVGFLWRLDSRHNGRTEHLLDIVLDGLRSQPAARPVLPAERERR